MFLIARLLLSPYSKINCCCRQCHCPVASNHCRSPMYPLRTRGKRASCHTHILSFVVALVDQRAVDPTQNLACHPRYQVKKIAGIDEQERIIYINYCCAMPLNGRKLENLSPFLMFESCTGFSAAEQALWPPNTVLSQRTLRLAAQDGL